MKIQFPKLSAFCQAVSVLSFGAMLSSCQLPKEKADRYAVAEWSVNSSVAKEDYPVGVALEQVDEALLPSPEQPDNGLADHGGTEQIGSGRSDLDPALPSSAEADSMVSEPHLASLGSEHAVSDELLNLDGPLTAPAVSLPDLKVRPALEEIRTAKLNHTPENLALMAASTTRPPQSPKGVNVASANPAPSEKVAATSTEAASPQAEDLSEILSLARQVEASHR